MAHKPTAEQGDIRDAFAIGDPIVIEAGAGTGKTSTLKMLAVTDKRAGLYLAFGRAIKESAAASFPSTVTCKTSHGLAYRTHAIPFKHRIRGARVPAGQTARILAIREAFRLSADGPMLQPNSIARVATDTVARFCRSADAEITRWHVPLINGFDEPAARQALAAFILPYALKAWTDLSSRNGQLYFTDDVYRKMFQLSDPVLPYDYLLVDEAQDLAPVVKAIVERQQAQLVYVGDRCQAIFGWAGARDAMETAQGKRLYLSQSFRFGDRVAEEANKWLEILDADLRLRGLSTIPSVVQPLSAPDAVLCRGNAEALSRVMLALGADIKVGLVGGGDDIKRLARAAVDLKAGRGTDHPELMAFRSWSEVQDYAENDAAGGDLKVLVKMVDTHGAEALIAAMTRLADERDADMLVSTAHKAKGLEWDRVQIAGDFRAPKKTEGNSNPEIDREEAMLAYVAVTRAKLVLDRVGLAWVDDWVPGGIGRPLAFESAPVAEPVTPVEAPLIAVTAGSFDPVDQPPVEPTEAILATAGADGFPVDSRVVYAGNRAPNRTVFRVALAYLSEMTGEWVYALEQPDGRKVRGVRHEFLELAPGWGLPVALPAVDPEPEPVLAAIVETHCRRCGSTRDICGPDEKARWLALTTALTADDVAAAVAMAL